MMEPLRPEVVTPKPSDLARWMALGASCSAALIGSLIAALALRPMAVARTVDPKPVSSELLFVFRAGGSTFVRLVDLEEAQVPKHGRLRLVDDREGVAAIGTVADADVPVSYRAYRGKRLRVDGVCSAKVVGLAVVARLAGDAEHAALEQQTWTTSAVMQRGAVMLAARLDGCEQGTYARDATLRDVVRPTPIVDQNLASVARSLVIASEPAVEAQNEWKKARLDGNWYDDVELAISVMRHPITDVVWVTAHGIYSETGCGGPEVNVWGLFRAGPNGMLETVDIRKLERLHSIDHVIDLEGDGNLEIVGKPWLGLETVLVEAAGERELDRLPMPFFGCGC
jgi:hypothetical protein